MLPIAELAREAALAVAVVVAGVYPAGAVDGATPDPAVPECAVASSSAEQDRCHQGEDASVAASDDTSRASIVRRDPDSSEPAPGSPGSTVSCDGRGNPGGNPGGGDQSSDDAATGGDDRAGNDNTDEVGPTRSSTAGEGLGSSNAQRTGPDSTGSDSTGSHSEDSESEDSEESGGEDSDGVHSEREDSKESGGSESEAEGSGDKAADDEERKHFDRESADGEAVQTRNATGERTELARQDDRAARYPADLINTDQWYLTLPTGEPGSPDTVEGDQLKTFSNDFFRLTPNRKGIVFAANAGGVTTENSEYPRSELLEMNGSEKAAWSNTSGTHTLEVCEAVTKVPDGKPEVVAAQIHDGSDDVMQIRLEDRTLSVQYDDGAKGVVLDKAYQLGAPYQLRIVAADRKVTVTYNGEQKAELPLSGSSWYWKVGAYVQANQKRSDPQALGEVIVYSAQISHDEGGDGAGPAGGGSGAVADEQKDSDERADDKRPR